VRSNHATHRRIFAATIAALVLVAAGAFAMWMSPGVKGADVAAIADEQGALKAFADGYLARAQAARDFDTSKLAQIYIDDASVPLTPLQLATLERIAPNVPKSGLLTYHTEFYKWWKAGNEAALRVKAAQDAKTAPNPEDVLAAVPAREDPIAIPHLALKKVDITSNRAVIEVDSDPAFFRVTLIKQGGRWFVAGEDRTPHE
jgi:hypothetical protein